jgi:GT2 family glycosyltransferase
VNSSKVSIGVPIYNNILNFKDLFSSINSSCQNREGIEFIVYNDGSTVKGLHEELESFCLRKGIKYIYNKQNKGVAFAWNRLTEAASNDIIILLNDDVRVYSENWIDPIRFIFENNEKIGLIYWAQRQINLLGVFTGHTYDSEKLLTRKTPYPGLRFGFCGAFFSFRKSIWQNITQPDSSIGFWEDLLSYGEEIDFSAEILNQGYLILQLPILFEHIRSQTFSANPEKKMRNHLSSFLPLNDFHEILLDSSDCFELSRKDKILLKSSKFIDFSRYSRILKKLPKLRTSGTLNVARLDYSMAMLLKKWNNRKILGFDGKEYLQKVYTTGYPQALRIAIEQNYICLPEVIQILDNDKTKVDIKECIDFWEDNFI